MHRWPESPPAREFSQKLRARSKITRCVGIFRIAQIVNTEQVFGEYPDCFPSALWIHLNKIFPIHLGTLCVCAFFTPMTYHLTIFMWRGNGVPNNANAITPAIHRSTHTHTHARVRECTSYGNGIPYTTHTLVAHNVEAYYTCTTAPDSGYTLRTAVNRMFAFVWCFASKKQ